MTPQFVDFNADGYNDLLMATFEGHVFLVKGSKTGFTNPEAITDKGGEKIRISMYWDDSENRYRSVDRSVADEKSDPSHHMTSAVAVDWDNDDDLDLLLGAYEGALYWCENEGTKSTPKFSNKNRQVKADGKHMIIAGGLATPVIADWNKDGLFDIVCGGAKQGVYLFKNVGEKGKPRFLKAKVLIGKTGSTFGRNENHGLSEVESVNGLPVGPGKSFHIDVLDYDEDGHLDILVGAQSYIKQEAKELTEEEQRELKEINKKMTDLQAKMSKLYQGKNADEIKKVSETEEAKKLQEASKPLWERMAELQPYPRAKEFVWLYRNKGIPETESKENTLPSKQPSSKSTGTGKLSLETRVSAMVASKMVELELKIDIPNGYHIYGSKDKTSPSAITLTDLGGLTGGTKIAVPAGTVNLSKGAPQYWLQDTLTINHQLSIPEGYDGGTIKGELEYMICDDKMCLPPSKIEFEIKVATR